MKKFDMEFLHKMKTLSFNKSNDEEIICFDNFFYVLHLPIKSFHCQITISVERNLWKKAEGWKKGWKIACNKIFYFMMTREMWCPFVCVDFDAFCCCFCVHKSHRKYWQEIVTRVMAFHISAFVLSSLMVTVKCCSCLSYDSKSKTKAVATAKNKTV